MRSARIARVAAAAVLIPVAAVPAAPALAAPAAQPGWRQVWSNDFSGSALPGQCTTYNAPHGGPADSYYTPDEVHVSGGMLRLGMRRQPKNGRNYATGGVTCYKITQRYGKFEYRARPPLGKGVDAYATLWPQDQTPDDDVLIEVLPRPGQEKAYLSSNHGGNSVHTTIGGAYSGAFHTYTIEWSPGLLRILLDGAPRLTDRHPGAAAKWIGFAVSSGDPLTGEPDGATQLPAEFDVDWVHVYAYAPGAAAATSAAASRTPAASPAVPSSPASAPAQRSAPASDPVRSAPALTAAADGGGAGGGLIWWALAGAVVVLSISGYALRRRRRAAGRHTPAG
ncbi:MAG: hypothetical protein V7603_2642 [Micromonosporaceae bacterium]